MPTYEVQDGCGQTEEIFDASSDEQAVWHVRDTNEKWADLLLLRVIPMESEASGGEYVG